MRFIMQKKVRHSLSFIIVHILCIFIEPIYTAAHFTVVNGEALEVRQLRVPSYTIGSRRDSEEDFNAPNGTYINELQNDQRLDIEAQNSDKQLENRQRKLHRVCVKCPDEIVAIAREGLDGILVEPPAPLACKTNLPFSHDLYEIETLFGPELRFVLPEGRHKFIAKVRNLETGLIVRSCLLKYRVIVRRCKELPRLKSRNLKMSCTAGTIWGSKCAFQCKNPATEVSHNEPMVCDETLNWVGHQPDCIRTEEAAYCKRPAEPSNGEFVCKDKYGNDDLDALAPGSQCHAQCHQTYSIPLQLQPLSIIECQNGAWNKMDIDLCYKEEPHRRYSSRRHSPRRQIESY